MKKGVGYATDTMAKDDESPQLERRTQPRCVCDIVARILGKRGTTKQPCGPRCTAKDGAKKGSQTLPTLRTAVSTYRSI